MTIKDRYARVLETFAATIPEPQTELHYDNPYQLLLAVILSAQCTDKRINMVTPALFNRFPTVQDLAAATPEDVYPYIRSVTYPNAKSKSLVKVAQRLVEEFGGEIPKDIDTLVTLPGVGRKTANVIQAVWFGKSTMAVDTHVFRVSHRMGLVPKTANTPYKVERCLIANIPEDVVPKAHHWLLLHGRYVCTSRIPKCDKCEFGNICPKILEGSKL